MLKCPECGSIKVLAYHKAPPDPSTEVRCIACGALAVGTARFALGKFGFEATVSWMQQDEAQKC